MEQGPSRDANNRSVHQDISRLSRNPEVHYHRHKMSLVPVHNQANQVCFLLLYFSNTYFNIIPPIRVHLPSVVCSFRFSEQHFLRISHFTYACHMPCP
jgi:hypothetical protein